MIARTIKEKINHENDDDDDVGDDILHSAHDRHLRDLWELAAALRPSSYDDKEEDYVGDRGADNCDHGDDPDQWSWW